jgi:hypothetical protein
MGPVIGIVIFLAVVSIPVIYHFRRRRRDERLIRKWVDKQNYALLEFYRPGNGPRSSGGWADLVSGGDDAGTYETYEMKVQDEQGGQFTLTASVSFTGKVRTTRL